MPSLTEAPPSVVTSPAQRLRCTMAAVRLSFTWFGTRKSLTAEQKSRAADAFGAEGAYLSAGKKLFDTQYPAFKAVTAIRGRAAAYWRGVSLPFPEAGIRLIRQSDIAAFDVHLTTLRAELDETVLELNKHYGELRAAAQDRLGRLFNAGDYPKSSPGFLALRRCYFQF